ncbi:MAG: hypothetical protein EBT08_14200, partial [Betaproteobacteria bacterium]|nr:hypothetical protein [Betaproteobacteria bacterium]
MNKMQFGGRVRCGLDRTLAALRDLRTLRGRMSDLALTLVAGAVLFVGASMAPASPASPWYYECYNWDYWSDCDGDGVANGQDNCPYEYGSATANGCPDMDGDGVRDSWDSCPNQAGSPSCNGCPSYCGSCTYNDCNGNGVADSCDLQTQAYGDQILRDGDFEQAVFNGCPSPCQTSCGFTLPEWTHGGITEDLIRNQDGCGYPNPSGGEYYVSL